MRLDYSEHGIDEDALHDDPLEQWRKWLHDAVEAQLDEPNTMVLATVENGQPRTRTVLAKGVAPDGIDFYTNYTSQKEPHSATPVRFQQHSCGWRCNVR